MKCVKESNKKVNAHTEVVDRYCEETDILNVIRSIRNANFMTRIQLKRN